MKLAIAQKLRPFCHDMGATCLIPFSAWKLKAYPTKLFIEHMIDGTCFEVELKLQGPIKDFTVQQDLLEGSVILFGKAKDGYFRSSFKQKEEGLCLFVEKLPQDGLEMCYAGLSERLTSPKMIVLHKKRENSFSISLERLCLGCHKAQDFSLMRRRMDMAELFPLWLRLGHIVPHTSSQGDVSSLGALLSRCKEVVEKQERLFILEAFEHLFMAGFSGMFVPRGYDEDHQGITPMSKAPLLQPLSLLSEGALLIRSLFIQEDESGISLLPSLPVEFSSGRLLGIKTQKGHHISLEWSKKHLRRVIIQVGDGGEIRLHLQKALQKFRLRKNLKSKGVFLSKGEPLVCGAGDTLYLDCFQK